MLISVLIDNQQKHKKTQQLKKGIIIQKKLIKNSAKCLKCGHIVVSAYKDDCVTCICKNLTIEGGTMYLQRTARFPKEVEELSEWEK